ncbi:MAG: SDR family NAD(P)-dependent oxidoreductase [Legionellales bacterium]
MKVAVITGAASGIGLALTKGYLQKGVQVVMVDIDSHNLKQQASELKKQYPSQILEIICDVRDKDSVAQLINQVERVDWIYNNAGIVGDLSPVWELDTANIHRVMEVNLYGMINLIQAFTPLLFKQNFRSHIINMASMYALCTGSQMASYSMSKHAVLALSESLYFDLTRLDKPVDVSVVFPSFTDTALLSKSSSTNQKFHQSLNALLSHSKPAEDVALHIMQEVENKVFFILPDKEVKAYCEERTQSIILQEEPHKNTIEKLMNSLMKRAG